MESQKESEEIKDLISKFKTKWSQSNSCIYSDNLDTPTYNNKENFLKKHKSEEICGNDLIKNQIRGKIYTSKPSLPKLGGSSKNKIKRAKRGTKKGRKPKIIKKPSISGALEISRKQDRSIFKEETVWGQLLVNLKKKLNEWRGSSSEKIRIYLVQIIMDLFMVTQKHWILGNFYVFLNLN